MNGPTHSLHFGFVLISLANLLVIALLIVVIVLACALRRLEKKHLSTHEALPTPAGSRGADESETAEGEGIARTTQLGFANGCAAPGNRAKHLLWWMYHTGKGEYLNEQ